jgi:hypothetical protein
MSEAFLNSIVSVLLAIIGVATLAVIVSKNADTGSVLNAGGNALNGLLKTAISPVSGSGLGGLSLPSFGAGYAN